MIQVACTDKIAVTENRRLVKMMADSGVGGADPEALVARFDGVGATVFAAPHGPARAGDSSLIGPSDLASQGVNSVSGVPYQLPIGSIGASTGVDVDGSALVRLGDNIPSGSGIMTILGPPAAPFMSDGNAP